jgi:hypothetical protein
VDHLGLEGTSAGDHLVEPVPGLGVLARRGLGRRHLAQHVAIAATDKERLLARQVVFLGPGAAAMFLEDLVLGDPRQETPEVPDVLESPEVPIRAREDALPDGLDEIHRVELGAQRSGQAGAHHHPDVLLTSAEEVAKRELIARLCLLN